MPSQIRTFGQVLVLLFLLLPSTLIAQTTHVIQVQDNFFSPASITVQGGDTVRWVNAPGGMSHNVVSDSLVFNSGGARSSFEFDYTFNNAGNFPYHCGPHRAFGMTGMVMVQGSVDTSFPIDPGHSGNWWNGPARSGEGAQIEVADGGGGELVFVATVYSYGPAGGQIFLIAVGTPDGDTVDVDVFITDGPVWGDGFDPADVTESQWGTGTFTSDSCDLITMTLRPNAAHRNQGYTNLSYDLVRLTTPKVACPYE
jgi:plastocyanin